MPESLHVCAVFAVHVAAPGWQIRGQVLSDAHPELGWRVAASAAGETAETSSNAHGEFVLRQLAPGRYAISLNDLSCEILIPEIDLPAL